jgi:cytochrome c
MKLVVQQGLSRSRWTEVLQYMVDEQEMPELEPEDHKLILDYLTKFYGPDRRARQ